MSNESKPDVIKQNLKSRAIWLRLLYMLLFAVIYGITELVLFVVVLFQFIHSFTGRVNKNLREFGQSLGTFIYQIVQFLTYNTEELPFPFGDWPKGPPGEEKSSARSTRGSRGSKKAS